MELNIKVNSLLSLVHSTRYSLKKLLVSEWHALKADIIIEISIKLMDMTKSLIIFFQSLYTNGIRIRILHTERNIA